MHTGKVWHFLTGCFPFAYSFHLSTQVVLFCQYLNVLCPCTCTWDINVPIIMLVVSVDTCQWLLNAHASCFQVVMYMCLIFLSFSHN